MGADVIKVESPEGDLMRSRPVQRDGAGTMFGQLNAGKRSIVLDLKKPEAIAAVKKLVKVGRHRAGELSARRDEAARPRLSRAGQDQSQDHLRRHLGLRPDRARPRDGRPMRR